MAISLLLVLLPLVLLLAWITYRFITADGDLSLLLKGRAPLDAFKNKVVWITGASQGIGEALAKEFARMGAKLILSSRRIEELERVRDSLLGPNGANGVLILPFDVTSSTEELQKIVSKAESGFGRIDYIVHNAAHTRPKMAALDGSEDYFKATFDINVMAPIRLTSIVTPLMISKGGGNIVLVSSVAGKVPSPAQAIYAASKHAVNGYFHSLRAELADKNIKVTVVCPGPIETSSSRTSTNKLERKLSVSRCAELIVIAAAHELKEAWISYHPILFLLYLNQYLPLAAYAILDKIGPKRIKVGNEQAYSLSLMFGQKDKKRD